MGVDKSQVPCKHFTEKGLLQNLQTKESGVHGTDFENPLRRAFSTGFPSRKGFASSLPDSFPKSSRTPLSLVWSAGATPELLPDIRNDAWEGRPRALGVLELCFERAHGE